MFRIGQKVVCVKQVGPSRYGEAVPDVGTVYTVRDVRTYQNGVGIRLNEIVNKPQSYRDGFDEAAYLATHFRHVVEKKTDISVFEEILKRETVDDSAPVNAKQIMAAFDRAIDALRR